MPNLPPCPASHASHAPDLCVLKFGSFVVRNQHDLPLDEVYDTDPAVSPQARRFRRLSYAEAERASEGLIKKIASL